MSVMICQHPSFPRNRNPYILKINSEFSRPWINTVYYGTESISNLGPRIWDLVPNNLKEMCYFDKFKKVIKPWNLRINLVDHAKCLKMLKIENVFPNMIFQDLVTRISMQCVVFCVLEHTLIWLRANGKCNIKLRRLLRRCQITSIWFAHCWPRTELINYSFGL